MFPHFRRLRAVPFALFLLFAGPLPGVGAPITSTFDSGLEGWLVTGDNAMSWNAAGGNPGGCLSVNDLAVGDLNYAVAPQAYLGDWGALGAGDSLSAEIYLHLISGNPIPQPWIFRIVGPGGAARAPIGASFYPTEDTWTRFAVSLSPADWTLESGTWAALVADVRTLYVSAEFVNGPEDCRIDNVSLSNSPSPRVVPCLAATFNGSTTEDWAFSGTAGVTHVATGGHPGGYVRVNDGAGVARAIAPPSFRGSWAVLDGSGRLSVDVRMLSAAGTALGAVDFLTLSGPGGAARYALAPADLPPVGPLWKTIEVPISAAAWTVTAGTWNGLLANVDDVRMTLDFHSGDEAVGFDNFARLGALCGEPDLRRTIHVTDLSDCGHASLEGLRGVAVDPATGLLSGVINQTTSAGGGLWRVTGPQAGVLTRALDRPAHLVFDPAGNAYVSEDFAGIVSRVTPAGVTSTWASGFHDGDDDPFGMCLAPAGFDGPQVDPGDVLVADRGNAGPDEIWAFSTVAPEGERLVVPDPGEVDWFDLAAGDSTVFVCDALDSTALRVVSPAGTTSSLVLQSPIPGANSIVRDAALGQLYVSSASRAAVYRVTIAGGVVELVANGFLSLAPGCLEFDAASRALWIVDQGANRAHRLCLAPAVAVDPGPGAWSGARLFVAPNPAAATQRIQLVLAHAAVARVSVFDVTGRRVRTLAERALAPGVHDFAWDGADDSGRPVPGGVYFVRVGEGDRRIEKKVVRVR